MTDFSTLQAHDVSRPLPEVDTLWFDVSTVLIMRPGFVSGITRTIYKIVEAWAANPWTKIRFCAFVPDQGLAEVCPAFLHRHMYQYDQNAPTRVHAEVDEVEQPRQHSRYWYIPWAMRHQYRSVERVVNLLPQLQVTSTFWYSGWISGLISVPFLAEAVFALPVRGRIIHRNPGIGNPGRAVVSC